MGTSLRKPRRPSGLTRPIVNTLQELVNHGVRLGALLRQVRFDLPAEVVVTHARPGVSAYRDELRQEVVSVEVQQSRESLQHDKCNKCNDEA